MKHTLLLVFFSVITVSAFAEPVSMMTPDAVSTTETAAPSEAEPKKFAIELSSQFFGSSGGSSLSTFSNSEGHAGAKYVKTDGFVSVSFRAVLEQCLDLLVSVPVFQVVNENNFDLLAQSPFVRVTLMPASIGARYHLSLAKDKLRPFVQADLGGAIIGETKVDSVFLPENPTRHYFSALARGTLGMDWYFMSSKPAYLGVKAGYLAVREFSDFTGGLDFGYEF